GHLISAVVGGWPLGPFHWLVALEMAGLGALFAVLHQRGWKIGSAAALVNVLIALAVAPAAARLMAKAGAPHA
ncbi:ECF transporter S component, partial [Geobacillus stearothermophilus]|nr:ECF transporter S component [Geobacillus stearothermophilus]